jgi:hypothetical protein
MKFAAICVILVVGLTIQSNGVDAIFWQFVKPFLSGSTTKSTTTTSAPSSGSTSGNSQTSMTSTNLSTGDLNQSNAILVSGNSTVMATVDQTFGGSSSGSANGTMKR